MIIFLLRNKPKFRKDLTVVTRIILDYQIYRENFPFSSIDNKRMIVHHFKTVSQCLFTDFFSVMPKLKKVK